MWQTEQIEILKIIASSQPKDRREVDESIEKIEKVQEEEQQKSSQIREVLQQAHRKLHSPSSKFYNVFSSTFIQNYDNLLEFRVLFEQLKELAIEIALKTTGSEPIVQKASTRLVERQSLIREEAQKIKQVMEQKKLTRTVEEIQM